MIVSILLIMQQGNMAVVVHRESWLKNQCVWGNGGRGGRGTAACWGEYCSRNASLEQDIVVRKCKMMLIWLWRFGLMLERRMKYPFTLYLSKSR
jgi:hypothetical protein